MKYILEKEPLSTGRKAFSVSEITRHIRAILEQGFTNICVEGEISNFKLHSSGHMYFSLKDPEAQLSCVMFRRDNHAVAFEPGDGMQVSCFGRVSVYAPRGQYQLYVERIEPKGLGALQMRYRQLQEKLKTEGLFDEARKRPIPYLARRVAIVTSEDGAALQDILNVLERRFSSAHLLIYPVAVQGAQAAPGIAEAIALLNAEAAADVLILARGGGSLEDLWAFNEEIVARAIFGSVIPVISAVGHETDFTIADFVADLRAPTPSAAAELVLPRRDELLARIHEMRARASQSVWSLLRTHREHYEDLRSSRALKDPFCAFEARFQRMDELVRRLGTITASLILSKKEAALRSSGKLDALGPLATLRRGFSVSLKLPEEKLVSSVRSVKVGDRIRTKLHDGFFNSRITEVGNG